MKIWRGLVKDYSDERHIEANSEELKFIISMYETDK